MIIFTPNTVIKSADMNANFAGLKDGSDIDNGAITTAKFAPSTLDYQVATGTNYSTTSTSAVAIGPSTTYTAGATNETLFVTLDCLIINGTNVLFVWLYVDGVRQNGGCYTSADSWQQVSHSWLVDVDAGQTATLALYWQVGAGTGQMSRSNETHAPTLRGWSFYRA